MNLKKCILFIVLTILVSPLFADDDTATLHNFYEQNGDCYVLVGSGTRIIDGHTIRGVYGLNNLSSTKSTEWIYNPDDAYGITAGQKYIAEEDKIEKRLYTFSGTDSPPQDINGQIVKRRIVATYSLGIWTNPSNPRGSGVPPYTVHRFHTWPNAASTGLGNHPSGTINSKFEGRDYPCNVTPTYAGTDSEGYKLYNYKVGDGFYHAMDYSVWSPFTYDSYCGAPDLAAADKANRTYSYGIDKYGGYVHYVIKEKLKATIRDLKIKKWNVNDHRFDPYESDDDVAKVTTKVTGKMDKKGECTDGCIREQPDVDMPGVPSPILKTAYSSQVKRSYLYNRPYGETSYTLIGRTSDDELKGNGNSLDCEHLGISSKSSTGNYVYLLGKDIINQWLTNSNYTGTKIRDQEDLACVCVSDQWWQTGGIVYAYDKRQGKIFCFNRVEKIVDLDGDGVNDTSSLQEVIDVGSVFSNGEKPDKIACDGFANLYVLRTEKSPSSTSAFIDGNEDRREKIFAFTFVAFYHQDVYKKVYCKPYGKDKTFSPLKNHIKIGENKFYRTYYTLDGKIDSPKIWNESLQQYEYADNPVEIPVEMAVINCPTPPRPDHLNARTDCVGPVKLPPDSYWQMATPDSDGLFNSNDDLFFIAENAPNFEGHGLNVGNYEYDLDGDGKVGRFPNTVIKNEVKYYWRIIQTHDREGNPLKDARGNIIEKQVLPSDESEYSIEGGSSLLFPSLFEGKFKVGVKVTYGYYDYSKLPVGSFMSDRDTTPGVHVTNCVAVGDDGKKKSEGGTGWSWSTIGQKIITMPTDSRDKGIIMTGTNGVSGNTFKPGRSNDGGACPSGCDHIQCNSLATFSTRVVRPFVSLQEPKFIMDGYSLCRYVDDTDFNHPVARYNSDTIDWAIKLRDTSYNISRGVNRVNLLKGLPPDPKDPKMVPGSLEWVNKNRNTNRNRFTITWKSELKDNDGNIIYTGTETSDYDGSDDAFANSNVFCLSRDKLRNLMPIPSEPFRYTIKASVESHYKYKYWHSIPMPKMEGGVMVGYNDPVDMEVEKYVKIYFEGNAEVCVTDNTGPGLFQYNPENGGVVKGYLVAKNKSDKFFLKATTGETISDTGNIDIYVADNNPFANYRGTKTVNKGETDIYHYISGDPKFGKLISNFDLNNTTKTAVFHYDTEYTDSSIVDVPGHNSSLKSNYIINAPSAYSYNNSIPESELETLGLSTSKTLSYTKYSFNISNIKHVSRKTVSGTNYYSPKFAYNYANNKSGYDNRRFGLEWRETCYSSNNKLTNIISGNNIEDKYKTHGGIIVITDNDRPNGFITATHDRIGRLITIPTGVATNSWIASCLDANTGPQNWYKTPTWNDKNSISNTCFTNHNNQYDIDYSGVNFSERAPEAATMLFRNEDTLYVDVPVKFTTSMLDNIDGLVELDNDSGDCFKIVCVEGETTQSFNKYLLDGGKPYIRQVFRKPGKYYVELKIKDKPKGFPTTYENAKKLVFPNATPNKRVIRAYFEVKDSKMEYRVLERNINGNE